MVASSNFKAAGFTEAVMQMNFWITHGLAHLSTLSSNWHFCVYFRQAQAFRCITTASLTLDILYFFWQRRIQISWYLDHPIFFCANLYSNNHRITSILLSLRYIDLLKVEIDLCHVTKTKWLMCHVNLWVGFPYPKSPPSYVWGTYALWKWKNNVLYLSRDHNIEELRDFLVGVLSF